MPTWILSAAPYVLAIALALGGIWYIYHKGQTDQAATTAADTLKQVGKDTRARAKIDTNERKQTDDAATKCLRDPNGC
jgi:uncharacterized protein HemX